MGGLTNPTNPPLTTVKIDDGNTITPMNTRSIDYKNLYNNIKDGIVK